MAHPNAQANVIPAAHHSQHHRLHRRRPLQSNLIWDEYSARFAEAEIEAVAMLANLSATIGPGRGVFTFGAPAPPVRREAGAGALTGGGP